MFGPLYSVFVVEVGGSFFHASSTWAAYMFTAGFLMFLCSKYEDSLKNKRVFLIVGYFVLAFGALSFAFVSSVEHVYLVQIINALGVGIVDPILKASYGKYEDKGKEAQEWALFDGGDKILIAIAAFLGGIFITYFSFSALFVVMFIIQLIAALLAFGLERKE